MKILKFMWLIIVSMNLVLGVRCNGPKEKQNVIANVGNKSLTLYEILEDATSPIRSNLTALDIREYVLRWIEDEVLYQEALNRKLDESIDLKKEFEKLKKELLINKLIEQTLDNQFPVSEEEITNYYENNKESYVLSQDVVHAYHILVKTRKEANTVRNRLKKGEAFEEIATSTSNDSLKNDNWDLGYFSTEEIIPAISKVVFNLPVGAYSLPIKSEFGYHIVKVIDKQKKGNIKPLNLVKEEIRLKLEEQKKQKNYQRFLLQTKSNYKIQTNFQLLDAVVLDSLIRKGDSQSVD
ncbi:MAG: peptidylprolyl isomerase [bacterium]